MHGLSVRAGHYVGTDGAIRIARVLTFPNQVWSRGRKGTSVERLRFQVRILDLSVSEIKGPGAAAVAEMLRTNTVLER